MEYPTPRYSFLAFQFNLLLDQGRVAPIDEVRRHIADGTLFDWLETQYTWAEHGMDLSLYDVDERRSILKVFQAASQIPADRKLGIEHNGLALCLAYCIQVMQDPGTYGDRRFNA